jgi:hypothetical protein
MKLTKEQKKLIAIDEQNFATMRRSRVEMSVAQFSQLFGDDYVDGIDNKSECKVHTYLNSHIHLIEDCRKGMFHCVVFNEDILTSELFEAEHFLFANFKEEMFGNTLNEDLLHEMCHDLLVEMCMETHSLDEINVDVLNDEYKHRVKVLLKIFEDFI